MRMGDWIMFRGRRRFVVVVQSGGLMLERVRPSGYPAPYVYYSAGSNEKDTTRVLKSSTVRARARARKLLEAGCRPWTKIEWDGDEPTYVHDAAKFPRRSA
jgi:hypothetical protein